MNTVYLGLFSTILNWILEKIFAPIFTFVGKLLGTVLSWLFENILSPILEALFEVLMPIFIEMIAEAMAGVNYLLLTSVLRIIDYIQVGFDVLIGIRPVTYTPAGGIPITDQTLLQVLIGHSSVGKVVLMVSLLGLGIAFLLSIYATAKSMFDLDFEGRRPVGQVLKSCFKTAISFLMVPLFVVMMVTLSGEVLKAVNVAMGGEQQTLGSTVFLISSLNAAKDESFNKDPSITDALRAPYAKQPGQAGYKAYWEKSVVEKDFKLSKIDFLVGDTSALFLIIVLGICLIVFVQRIFDIMMLYVVSPLFVSMTPLDDGEKLSKWREMFVGKVFTGFGSAIGMRLYLMMVPLVMSSKIDFTAGGYTGTEMNYVIKLLFVMGGAWAVYKSSSLLTSLFSFQAAQSEQQMSGIVGGFIAGNTLGRVGGAMRNGMSSAIANGRANSADKKAAKDAQKQGGQDGKFTGGAGSKPGAQTLPGGKKPDLKLGGFEMNRDAKGKLKVAGFKAGGFSMGRSAQGKLKVNQMGIAGFKFSRGKDGLKLDSSKFLNMQSKEGKDGKRSISSFKVAGMSFGKGEDGKMKLQQGKTMGISYKRDVDGKVRLQQGSTMGFNYARHSDGKVHLTSIGQGVNFSYKQGEDGKTQMGSVKMGESEFHTVDKRPQQQESQQQAPQQQIHHHAQQNQNYQQQPELVTVGNKSAQWHLGQQDDTPQPPKPDPNVAIKFEPQQNQPKETRKPMENRNEE